MTATTRRNMLKVSASACAAAAMAAGAGCSAAAEDRPAVQTLSDAAGMPQMLPVNHDLHTHTVWSDGAHPIDLHVLEARAFELDAMAVTDHVIPGMKLYESEDDFAAYLAELDRVRAGQSDVRVVKGAEATALDATGRISLDARRAARLEWILCDLGGKSEGTFRAAPTDKTRLRDNVLSSYMGMCDVPYLDVIAHPFNTGNLAPALLPSDYPEPRLRELAEKMAARGKVFDVMNDQIYWFSKSGIAPRALTAEYVDLVKIFARAGVRFQASSDDHRTGVGNTRWSRIVLARAGVPMSQVVDGRKIKVV